VLLCPPLNYWILLRNEVKIRQNTRNPMVVQNVKLLTEFIVLLVYALLLL
jgi:hypothetical protein